MTDKVSHAYETTRKTVLYTLISTLPVMGREDERFPKA
jgi:hypothetical protein